MDRVNLAISPLVGAARALGQTQLAESIR
jgi:hypothetical protein